jgi:electron transfer flavoprotein beta subunit
MKIVIPLSLVPDLVEELEIDESGTAIDTTWTRMILSEFDDHAIEQAILIKEEIGGEVIIVGPDIGEVDDALYSAAAKGGDRFIKLQDDFTGMNNHAYARCLADLMKELQPDLILKGVQSHNDLDGQVGALLAEYLGFPYIGYVAGIRVIDDTVLVKKEYPGGLIGEYSVRLPAVLGIQASEKPPRYVAFSKIRQAMQTAVIEDEPIILESGMGLSISRMYPQETGTHAQMIEGSPAEIAERILHLMIEAGIL